MAAYWVSDMRHILPKSIQLPLTSFRYWIVSTEHFKVSIFYIKLCFCVYWVFELFIIMMKIGCYNRLMYGLIGFSHGWYLVIYWVSFTFSQFVGAELYPSDYLFACFLGYTALLPWLKVQFFSQTLFMSMVGYIHLKFECYWKWPEKIVWMSLSLSMYCQICVPWLESIGRAIIEFSQLPGIS